jgi:thiosulfate dehydrogenase [quinone] large subunit
LRLVTVSELVIGALLILGLFTGAAAVAGLSLNIIYLFTGSAGVNPLYAIVSVFLILAWRNAGYLGLDQFALPRAGGLLHRTTPAREHVETPPQPASEPAL